MTNRTVIHPPRVDNTEQSPTPANARPLLVSALDAARSLGIGRTTLYELVKAGELTPIHLRRCVRFSMYEIEQYVQSLFHAA
jgi:excisionase family DNA binding protein